MGKMNIVQKFMINIFTKNECASIFVLMYNFCCLFLRLTAVQLLFRFWRLLWVGRSLWRSVWKVWGGHSLFAFRTFFFRTFYWVFWCILIQFLGMNGLGVRQRFWPLMLWTSDTAWISTEWHILIENWTRWSLLCLIYCSFGSSLLAENKEARRKRLILSCVFHLHTRGSIYYTVYYPV